jgi:Mce-associated membrane protein
MGLVVLVALAAVLAGALGLRACSASATQKATEAALAAAKTRTAQLLSFSAPTLEPDLARARQQVTGDFAPRFNQLLDTLIVPSIQQRSITTKATVARAGVVSVEPAKVVILLFINQETTTAARATPVQATSQAKVTMTKVGDAWLISDFAPI